MQVDSNYVLPVFRQGSNEFQPGDPVDPLPTYIPPRESPLSDPALALRYPLNLLAAKPHTFLNSCFGNLPKHRKLEREPKVIIHPEDAARRGIVQGQIVKVFNDRGSFQVAAQVSDDVRPGVVVAPLGHWRKLSHSRSTINAATSSAFADLGHVATVGDSLVEVKRCAQEV